MAHELVGKSVKVITASGTGRTGTVLEISEGLIKMSRGDGSVWVSVGQVEELNILETPIRDYGNITIKTVPHDEFYKEGVPGGDD